MENKFQIISAKSKELGAGFVVSRSLPSANRRSVGPFVFVDHMGPIDVNAQRKLDVRPHPHIGLATVTYLFDGQGLHRDSLGYRQIIKPGDINWMTAGRGIVHSERTPEELLKQIESNNSKLHGLQVWVALPKEHEDTDPSFKHYPSSEIPTLNLNSSIVSKLLIGELNGIKSPVQTLSRTLYVDLFFREETDIKLNVQEQEWAIYVIQGHGQVENEVVTERQLWYSSEIKNPQIKFTKNSRIVLFGGDQLPEPRYMWWNFVSSSLDKIKSAAALWEKQQLGQVPEESEFIPLPKDPFPAPR